MKKRRVIISNKARDPIKDYVAYLKENASDEVAEKVKKGILAKCKSLKDFSGYSRERYLEDTPVKYCSVTQWNYNIIYTVTEEDVQILNIIHTSRHPDKRKDI